MRTSILVACGIALTCVACASDGVGTPGHVVRDSAGVRIVESASPAWPEGATWRVGEQPLVQIGGMEGNPDYELFRVVGALRLSDGRIVVANAGTRELRFFDSEGGFLFSSGGQGDGPGEFQALMWISPFRGDSLMTYDLRQRRLSVFDTQGQFHRSTAVLSVGETIVRVAGVFGDGSLLSYGTPQRGPDAPIGLVRDNTLLFVQSETGDLVDSLGPVPGDEMFIRAFGGGIMLMQPFFGRSTVFYVHADRFYVATNDSYEIKVHSQGGTLTSLIRRQFANLEVTDEDVQTLRDQQLDNDWPAEMRQQLEDIVNAMPTPETMPAFASVLLDDLGNVWVEEYRRPGDEVRCWTVFDTGGVMLGTVPMPAGFRLLQPGRDHVLGTWRDDLDVEHVQLYALIKGEV